ncbi:VRR-NUC domain-containing protein [Vibrio caribbeanicus]|uniref:VRR-NUC domain-containing protein n=1 Tax=Vibrio caribbeanicus TaxID=701175 RepID=UPI0030DA1735
MSKEIELPADYYLDNFLKLIRHSVEWYEPLLKSKEQKWINKFICLKKNEQCLLVRLLSRKGCWFRSDKLRYDEIESIPSALMALEAAEFVTINPNIEVKELCIHLLTKPEIVSLFPHLKANLKKDQLIELLPADLFKHHDSLSFSIIHLSHAEIINVLLALFFGNTQQDLSQFVLNDLGLQQFENYSLEAIEPFFKHREQLDQLLTVSTLQSQYYQDKPKDADSLLALLENLPKDISHPHVERKKQHFINLLARDLERLGEYTASLKWFSHNQLPPSRERRARIFDKLNQHEKMSDIVTDMLSEPLNVAEQETATKLLNKLKRISGEKVPRVVKPKIKEYQLTLTKTNKRVEYCVKEYFEALGYEVYYAENALLNGLFGLTFWQAIFAPISGAFINQYQYRPLDLYHSDFRTKRHVTIEACFKKLTEGSAQDLINIYHDKANISNPFVQWSRFDIHLLERSIHAIPLDTMVELFQVLFSDLKLYRNGMPDLILFKDSKYEWVEVKGPGDKIQDNQWRWFSQFLRIGVPFAVANVDFNNKISS